MLVLRITVNQHDESVGITENGDELEEKTHDNCSENGAPQTQRSCIILRRCGIYVMLSELLASSSNQALSQPPSSLAVAGVRDLAIQR
jgi:hypothetical protein